MKKQTKILPGYKPSLFGPIPNDWVINDLKDLVDENRTIRYGIVQPGEFDVNGRYLVRGQDYSFGWVSPENLFKVSDEIEIKYKNARIKEGDILITIVGAGTGTVAIVPDWLEGANITQTTARIAIKLNSANSLYCYYFLGSPKGKKLTYQNIKGGAQPGLNCGDLDYYQIPLPPLPEQTAIANLLSTWDKAIQSTNQLIEQKQNRKKWLMQMLLTGKKRLKGFEKEKWKEVRLGDLFDEIKDVNDGASGHNVMTISSRLGLISQEDKFDRVIAGDSLKKYTQLKKYDFAYNKGNSKTYQMGCIYQLEDFESALVPFVYICFSPTAKINSKFYKHWFLAHGLDRQLKQIITSGARGDGLLNVNTEDFFDLKVPYPAIEEQKQVALIMEVSNSEIQLLNTKLNQLKEQKKGLMQILLTGKKRLKY